MDAIKKQASKLREQVARQQQAVLKQFGAGGYGSDNPFADDSDIQQHQKLEKLYVSTRAAKHFQRDIVRGVEGYIVTGAKQLEIGTKLSEDSRKYGAENTCTSGNTLSKAALSFSRVRALMEKERGNLLKALGTQVAEPLRAMVMGAPLEDARHLAQRYDRMRQEAEAQVAIFAPLYLKLRSDSEDCKETQETKAAQIAGILKADRGRLRKDAFINFLVGLDRDLGDLVFIKPMRVKIKFDIPNHPKTVNSRDTTTTLTDSSINVNVALN